MKLLVKKSLPLFFVSLITFIVFRVDILLLQFFEKKEDIAFYTNAVKLSEPWVFLSTAIAASLFPRLLALKKMSQLRYYKALRAKILIVIALSVSLSLVLSFFSPFIVTTLFGSKYIPTIDLFRIHVWSNVFLFLAAAQSNWDVLENKTQYSAYKTLVAAIYNVIANLIFIPKYGALACTVNSLITYFILSIGGNILFKKTRYFNKQIILSAKEWSRLKLFLTDIIKRQINSLKE